MERVETVHEQRRAKSSASRDQKPDKPRGKPPAARKAASKKPPSKT
jgi:hypothetical protein